MGEEHEGWTNRETWLVNKHYSPRSKADLDHVKDSLGTIEAGITNCFLKDYIDFSRIDWHELEEALEEKEEE